MNISIWFDLIQFSDPENRLLDAKISISRTIRVLANFD